MDQQKQSAPPLCQSTNPSLCPVPQLCWLPTFSYSQNRPQPCPVDWKTIRPFMCMVIPWHKCLQRYSLTGTGFCRLDGSTRWLFTILVFLTCLLTSYKDRFLAGAWQHCPKQLYFGIFVLHQLEYFSCIFFTHSIALDTNRKFNFTTTEFSKIKPHLC